MSKFIVAFFILIGSLWAASDENITIVEEVAPKSTIESSVTLKLRAKLESLDDKKLDNVWTKTYSSYIQQKELIDKQRALQESIKKLKKLKSLTKIQKDRLKKFKEELKVVNDKIKLVNNFEDDPFKKIIQPPTLKNAPKITNPLALIGAYSYIKELDAQTSKYDMQYKSLSDTIDKIKKKKQILAQIVHLSDSSIDKQHLKYIDNELKELLTIKDIFKTTREIYKKKADEVKISINKDIQRELKKLIHIGIIALVFLFFYIISKLLTRRYLANKDSFYAVNKTINIIFISLILLTLLFEYLENISYLITILGFASAGIAIAMKDWFMSLMGWFVIVIGGAIHIGDRIKFVRGNTEYVGDVIDISLLRITLHEDITLTTYMHNRRAGRVIFIPNNFIFTDMLANYSHSGLKTVWDGIDFYITFDSNSSKAMNIAKNIAKTYSKGYTDITRKQLNKLRSKYQLKNSNVEPRVFSFIEGYGMKVSVWYLTNSYATLTLRTTISTKIIEEINRCEDIALAYPTQSIYHQSEIPKALPFEDSNE